ncbi:Ribosome-recycling factor, mitochondrial [Nymphon striatum]|nr:Ribosome-recycling factor, mitochondrial [Nymphon striatum]
MSELIDVSNLESMLHNVVEELKETFFKNLSLRTDTGAFDNLIVELEGDSYPLNELAQINHKTADLIVINMVNFPQALKSVLTTIISSGINVNPQQDGTMIYVKLPKYCKLVSREHREALSKNAKTLFNDSKIKLRNIQNGFIKKLAKMKDVASEDLLFNVQQQIMVMVKEVEAELEKLTKLKQDELLKNVK